MRWEQVLSILGGGVGLSQVEDRPQFAGHPQRQGQEEITVLAEKGCVVDGMIFSSSSSGGHGASWGRCSYANPKMPAFVTS